MVNIINSWAKGIILAVMVSTIIEIILPEGNSKKYVKTIIGIYILFVIVQPLISKISNKNIDITSIIKDTTSKINKYETNDITVETNSYIKETYKQKIEEDIKKGTNEKGYNINFLKFDIEIENEENYGQINNIVMQISKIKDDSANNINAENTVSAIQNVEIRISNNSINEDKNEEISKQEIETFKEYLYSIYGIKKENIHVNE